MKIYHVHGIRHQAVAFAHIPEDAVHQAIEQELIGDWVGVFGSWGQGKPTPSESWV